MASKYSVHILKKKFSTWLPQTNDDNAAYGWMLAVGSISSSTNDFFFFTFGSKPDAAAIKRVQRDMLGFYVERNLLDSYPCSGS